MPYSAESNQTVKVASGLNVLLGAWLVLAPWLLGYAGSSAMWNDILVGLVVLIVAAIKLAKPVRYISISWINVVLGLWLILAPFVLRYGEGPVVAGINRALWNDVGVGIFVVVLAWLSATMTSRPAS